MFSKNNTAKEYVLRSVAEIIQEKPAVSILDFACGTCLIWKSFFEKFGIDVADTELSVGKKVKRIKPVDKRKASRNLLNEKEKSITVDILKKLSLKTHDRNFNPLYTNLAWVKKKVSKEVNKKLSIKKNQRKTIDNTAFDGIEKNGLLKDVSSECLQYFQNKLNEK